MSHSNRISLSKWLFAVVVVAIVLTALLLQRGDDGEETIGSAPVGVETTTPGVSGDVVPATEASVAPPGTTSPPTTETSTSETPPSTDTAPPDTVTPPRGLASLAEFPIGAAVPGTLAARGNVLDRPDLQGVVRDEFDEITPENIMKPDLLHPARGQFDFAASDALVSWAEESNIGIHGHALIFEAFSNPQVADWMLNFNGTPDEWKAMLNEHVETIVGRYAGRIQSWDVVNEALSDSDGSIRQTAFQRGIGDSYIEEAFRAARRADPDADLYYNDYKFPDLPHKLDGAIDMANDFVARGVPLDGIGFQMHVLADFPKEDQIREAFRRAAATGLKVKVTELDVRVNSGGGYTTFGDDLAQMQARQIEIIVRTYLEEVPPAQRGGITMWGVSDPDSYLAGGPDWTLLFTDTLEKKPAYFAFDAALRAG